VAQEDADARTLTDGQGAPTSAFLLARRAFAKNHPEIVMTALRTVDQAAAWSEQHQDKLAAIMAQVTGVDLSAEAVAAARAAYHYDLLDDADIKQQQGLADTFAALRIIPAPIDVRADVWTPPKGVSQ
jgi:sulfonate transport system substrate-binding protein